MKVALRAFLGPLLEALIPIDLERRQISSGGDIESKPATQRVAFVAAAADVLRFDARRMLNLEGPKNSVQHMAAHVAQRTVAKIVPPMPFMWVQVLVEIPIRRRADPLVPMQARRDRHGRRARSDASVGPISPAMRLGDVSHYSGRHELAKPKITIHAMALVPHLGRRFGLARKFPQVTGLGDIMR